MGKHIFWNTVAGRMRVQPYYLGPELAAYKQEELLRWLRQSPPLAAAVILKTDCFEEAFGNDALAPLLSQVGGRVFAVDISLAIVAAARRRFPALPVCWLSADITHLPLQNESVDLIVSSSTYGYLADPLAGLREAWRVLKPGGTLYCAVNNRGNYWFRANAALFRRLGVIPFPLSRPFFAEEFRGLLTAAGFLVEQEQPIVHIMPLCNSLRGRLLHRTIAFLRMYGSRGNTTLRRRTAWFLYFQAQKPASACSENSTGLMPAL